MKKSLLLIVVGMLCSIGVMAENITPTITTQMNPFAYYLEAAISADNSTITIEYCLNADAKDVTIVFSDENGWEKSFTSDKLTKSQAYTQHAIDISTEGFPTNRKITWRIDVKGEGRDYYGKYSQDGTNIYRHKFYRPSSVDIIQDPSSSDYGKVLVVESQHKASTTSGLHSSPRTKKNGNDDPQGAGIYVFNPDLTPRYNNSETYVFNGTDDSRFTGTEYAPYRVRVSEDGRMFVSSLYPNGDILWEINKDFKSWSTVIGEGVTGTTWRGNQNTSAQVDTDYRLNTTNGDFIAAPCAGLDVRGKGEELKLLLLSCTEQAFGNGQPGFHTHEYNLGTAKTWNQVPSKDFQTNYSSSEKDPTTGKPKSVFAHIHYSNVQYDKNGGIWCISYRDQCTDTFPGLVHKDVNAVENIRILRSGTKNAGFRFNKSFNKVMMATTGGYGTYYDYDPTHIENASGTKGYFINERNINMSEVGTFLHDFAWDNANNIYVVGAKTQSGGEGYLAVYCLPYDANDVFTTDGPKSFTIAGTAQDPSTPEVGSSSKYEFRGQWFTTVNNIDWPKTKATTDANREKQKQELIDILDRLQAGNVNAVCLQVRSLSDALYASNYEPWAAALTGTRGTGPGYDPLQFAIDEAHKRGIELHAWVNPFRVTSSSSEILTDAQIQNLYKAPTGKTELNPAWILKYSNGKFTGTIIDPGIPAAREYITNVLMDIVDHYDIDGILMDDYFYPYGGTTTEDATSKSQYKGNDVQDINNDGKTDDDWRRSNIDALIKNVYEAIEKSSNKKHVRFGVGPFGIWTMESKAAQAYGISLPTGIVGQDTYQTLACNPIEWIKNGYVDYIAPQLYWATSTTGGKQNYGVLCEWWAKLCDSFSNDLSNNKRVHFYPSHALYKLYELNENTTPASIWDGFGETIDELRRQIDYNRANPSSGYSGSLYFRTGLYNNPKNTADVAGKVYDVGEELRASHYQTKALVPPMAWKSNEVLEAPNTLRISGNTLTWQHNSAERYTVYIYPKGIEMEEAMKESAYLQMVVYGNSFALPASFDVEKHNIAVCSYDRYGVEHYATEYEAPLPDVTYVLNGGILGKRGSFTYPEVPKNAELWEVFKAYYNTFYNDKRYDQPINMVTTFMNQGQKIMTDASSEYKWLGDYILSVAAKQNIVVESTEGAWRYNVHHFFNCSEQGSYWDVTLNKSVPYPDYSTAGKPEKWGPYYQEANKKGTEVDLDPLPETIVGSEFLLPRGKPDYEEITHPSGCNFLGWFDNPDMTGEPLTTLSVGYTGTVYAKWEGIITWILNGGKYTGEGTLPTTVDADYTLPTAAEMARPAYVFGGWYEDAAFTGDALTTISANYTGVLHAKWIPACYVTWHPDHCHDVSNEDLWQLFMEDWNAWYKGEYAEKKITETKFDQLITNAYGFTFPADKNADGSVKYPGGLVEEFMTNPKSTWKWLGDYIVKVAEEENNSGTFNSNVPLWIKFKEVAELDIEKPLANCEWVDIGGNKCFPQTEEGAKRIRDVFTKPEWKWLADYIESHDTKNKLNVKPTEVSYNSDKNSSEYLQLQTWRAAIASFFLCLESQYPFSTDFSTLGQYTTWSKWLDERKQDYNVSSEDFKFSLESENEWRKQVAAFFNASNEVNYSLVNNVEKKEGTLDFRTKGQPKPNGDPNAGWYSTWSKATFPEYIAAGQALPKVRRDGYVFAGWCCGNAAGYDYNTRMFGSYDETMEGKNHLWARWLELCLYEGYAEKDVHSLQEPDKVNHNVELAQYADGTDTGKSHKIAIHRNFISDGKSYSTLVLPFAIARDKDGAKSFITKITDADGNAIFDVDTLPSILKFIRAEVVEGGVNGEDMVNFVFEEQDLKRRPIEGEEDKTVIPPYTPFLFRSPVPMPTWTQWWAAFIHDEGRFSQPQMGANGLMFKRVFEPSVVEAPTEGAVGLILVDKNRLAKVTKAGEMLGLRGYFIYEGEAANMPSNITIRQETTTDVSEVKNVSATEMQVEKILRNGHIYILRDGKTYTIMGARVE